MKSERTSRPTFRLLDLEDAFYAYSERIGLAPSPLIRYFIKQGLKERKGLSFEQHKELKNEIAALSKSMLRIGGNLNQIARYFNEHNHLVESDLHNTLKAAQVQFKETTKCLSEVKSII